MVKIIDMQFQLNCAYISTLIEMREERERGRETESERDTKT